MKEIHDFLSEIDQLDDEGRAEVLALIDRTTELKQLPLVARKVMQVIENPRSTAGDLERVLLSDQALTIKILKIANSSFYGLLRKVTTLQRAILVVGFKAIKDIAVSTAILNMYRSSEPLSLKLWENAVGTGIAARFIALSLEVGEVDDAFVAGLLHNLGRVVMLKAHPNEFNLIFRAFQEDPNIDDLKLERQVFHYGHTHVGGSLVRSWNLAPNLEMTLRYYRNWREIQWTDIDAGVKENTAIVSLASRYCRRLGIGYDHPFETLDLLNSPEVAHLKLNPKRVEDLVEEIRAAFYEEGRLFA